MFETDGDSPGLGIGSFTLKKGHDPLAAYGAEPAAAAPANTLDSQRVEALRVNLMGHFLREMEHQSENRSQMAQDEDFYDNEQWSAEDKAELQHRGQHPIVYNVIATTINWILGTQRKSRTDFKIKARRDGGQTAAERKTDLMKYLRDANSAEMADSGAFSESVKAGLGWLEGGVQDEDEGEPIYDRCESWRNIIYDSKASRLDLADARYMFRPKWMDVDDAIAYFPKRRAVIQTSAVHGLAEYGVAGLDTLGDEAMDAREDDVAGSLIPHTHNYMAERSRVRLIEGWFRIPVTENRMRGGDFAGEIFDPWSRGHIGSISRGEATVHPKITHRMYVMIFVSNGALHFSKSPYRHNHFPFTPVWGNRKASTGQPYGLIRNLRDIQADINKRASKALAHFSTNKIIMDEGAVRDVEQLRREAARPDAIIEVLGGKTVNLNVDRELGAAHVDLMSRGIQMIESVGGVTDENMGRSTNATSGKAIVARQNQGSLATFHYFDNLRYAKKVHGAKQLSLMEQYMEKEKQIRISDKNGQDKYLTLNDGLPQNDITATKADFIIDEVDWNATMREHAVEVLSDLIQSMSAIGPQAAMVVLDVMVDLMDIPHKDAIVQRIRRITGMVSPDADPQNPDPETAEILQMQAAQAQMAQRAQAAEISKVEADAAEAMARAGKAQLEARKDELGLTADQIASFDKAFELALKMLSAPQAVPVADEISREAGASAAPAPALPAPQPDLPEDLPTDVPTQPAPAMPI